MITGDVRRGTHPRGPQVARAGQGKRSPWPQAPAIACRGPHSPSRFRAHRASTPQILPVRGGAESSEASPRRVIEQAVARSERPVRRNFCARRKRALVADLRCPASASCPPGARGHRLLSFRCPHNNPWHHALPPPAAAVYFLSNQARTGALSRDRNPTKPPTHSLSTEIVDRT
jgi:hypothetical protein